MLDIEYIATDSLQPYEGNAKEHPPEQVQQIMTSIQEFGMNDPIAIWGPENMTIEGHGRWLACTLLGMPKVPVIRLDDLTDEQRRAYTLVHNKLTLNSEFNLDKLELELAGITDIDMGDFGFLDFDDDSEPVETQEDDYDEPLPTSAKSKLGDIYRLGDHYLMVGDSTNYDDVAALMAAGQPEGEEPVKADLCVTDPPYNVAVSNEQGLTIKNDNMADFAFIGFLTDAFGTMSENLKPGAPFYIWYASRNAKSFLEGLTNNGLQVRQQLIWVKGHFVLGHADYMWQHEPCQPAGTMVLTPDGEKPIEELHDGDVVVSYDTMQNEIRKAGKTVKTASRHYKGTLYGICAGGKRTWATNNHEFSVRFNPDTANAWCTYIMRKGDWWRVGTTRTYDARGFGLKHRFDQEHAEEAWLVETFESRADAQMGEQLLSTKYGIPYTHWVPERGVVDDYAHRTDRQIRWLYDQLDLEALHNRAQKLLQDHGRDSRFPLVTQKSKRDAYSRRVTARIHACNIIPGLMMVPVLNEEGAAEYAVIDKIDTREHDAKVFSLAVEKYEHYVADGIVTHNCLYGWKEGPHYFRDSRRESTILEIPPAPDIDKLKKDEAIKLLHQICDYTSTTVMRAKKPAADDMHPTMKPITLIAYQVQNSSRKGDTVLDLFGGSGTTLIACEQTQRLNRTMEYDPIYADVIIDRWEKFTGRKAELLGNAHDGTAQGPADQADGEETELPFE